MQPPRQSGVQAIGQEGDEDMRFDPGLVLMEDRPDGEVALSLTWPIGGGVSDFGSSK